jgi:hypothetical protein
MTKFVVIGDARSGTTWLADMIRQHPNAACLMEPMAGKYDHRLFHHQYYWPDDDAVWVGPDPKPQGVYAAIGDYFDERVWPIPRAATGAKLLSFYFSYYKGLNRYLQTVEDLRVIRIERNPLRKALSDHFASILSNWNAQGDEKVKERKPCELDWAYLRRRLQEYEQNAKNMDRVFKGRPLCRVYYHNLAKFNKPTMDEVCNFLEIDPLSEYTTVYHKMTPQSFEELVLNWQELKERTPPKWRKHWERDKS